MAINTACLLFFCFSRSSISAAAESAPASIFPSPPIPNSFRIFNALHSATRQWGSSLNYNGMSFFPALVPKGIEFYRGQKTNKTVSGMEWLAFEPEHAQIFTTGPQPPPKDGNTFSSKDRNEPPKKRNGPFSFQVGRQQLVGFKRSHNESETRRFGYLYTYITKRDLQLLYIDGTSAGKSSNGTLDSQDYIILNSTERERSRFKDHERGKALCAIAASDWKGRVDGFLRMEAGFEIILCDFAKSLDVRRITRAGIQCFIPGGCKSALAGLQTAHPVIFAFLRAVSDRYHGIGGDRVSINYDHFVTAYAHDIDLFKSSNRAPRLDAAPEKTLSAIRAELDTVILSEPNPFTQKSTNWQAVTDMIVTHYSARLQYLASLKIIINKATFLHELGLLLSPFIDYQNRSLSTEIDRCSSHFLPLSTAPSIASRTVSFVSTQICETLFSLTEAPQNRVQTMHALIQDLNWTTWKHCKGCGWDEVCLAPIWPFGTETDWIKPSCVNATGLFTRFGFWGPGPGGNGPGQAPKPDKGLKKAGNSTEKLVGRGIASWQNFWW